MFQSYKSINKTYHYTFKTYQNQQTYSYQFLPFFICLNLKLSFISSPSLPPLVLVFTKNRPIAIVNCLPFASSLQVANPSTRVKQLQIYPLTLSLQSFPMSLGLKSHQQGKIVAISLKEPPILAMKSPKNLTN